MRLQPTGFRRFPRGPLHQGPHGIVAGWHYSFRLSPPKEVRQRVQVMALGAEGDSPGMGRLLTLEEAGEVVGRSPSTVRTWLNTSRLDGFKLNGRTWRIRESALRSFIERQESGEHEPPTIRSSRSVELGDWRNHVRSGFDQF